jgi:hypothetical protein
VPAQLYAARQTRKQQTSIFVIVLLLSCLQAVTAFS